MTDIPIIFSPAMARALLEGRKTMTRRLASSPLRRAKAGDRLYVREMFRTETIVINGVLREQARYPEDQFRREFDPMKYKPSIHMPRWASRMTLVVTATKIERLNDITEDDARAEGVELIDGSIRHPSYWQAFASLWSALHGPPNEWTHDPEVVALTFIVHKQNIDELKSAA